MWLVEFSIHYMYEDSKVPIILGRPFLLTRRENIDLKSRELMLIFLDKKVIFNVYEAMHQHDENIES